MNIFDKIKNILKKFFNIKTPKLIEQPRVDYVKNDFREKIKIEKKLKLKNEEKAPKGLIIKTLTCINDGLGFQKIKRY